MQIISFNINGIRARFHQLQEVCRSHPADIVALQEIKVHSELYPHADVQQLTGRVSQVFGQKAHHGVATLTQRPVAADYGFPEDDEFQQRRLLISRHPTTASQDLVVINGYFPQGESNKHPTKWPAKRKFYADLLAWLENHASPQNWLVILGDFNIAPLDNDIGIGEKNHKRWLREGKSAFLPEERAWYEKLLTWGLTDSYRHLYPHISDRFSWFDYRSKGFADEPKRGLRIDHILVTAPLVPLITGAGIDYQVRSMEKPSDHAPVWLGLDINLR